MRTVAPGLVARTCQRPRLSRLTSIRKPLRCTVLTQGTPLELATGHDNARIAAELACQAIRNMLAETAAT